MTDTTDDTLDVLVADASARGDAALLAAAGRAGVPLPADTISAVRALAADGLAPTVAASQVVLAPTADAAPPVDSDHPPPLLTTPKVRKALLALLAATGDPDAALPYPGRTVPVADVLDLARPTSEQARRHLLGALRDLDLLGYCVLDEAPTIPVVRPGPQLATWDDPWVRQQLPRLCAQVRGDLDDPAGAS